MKSMLTEANWEKYYGNNHHRIDPPQVIAGGGVRFAQHIGKSLSQELWEDLIHRLGIGGLCIYKPKEMQWCLGWPPGHCLLYLNENNEVKDIYYNPHKCFLGHANAGENNVSE